MFTFLRNKLFFSWPQRISKRFLLFSGGILLLLSLVGVAYLWLLNQPKVLGISHQSSPLQTSPLPSSDKNLNPSPKPKADLRDSSKNTFLLPCDKNHLLAGECHLWDGSLVMLPTLTVPPPTVSILPNPTPTVSPQPSSPPLLVNSAPTSSLTINDQPFSASANQVLNSNFEQNLVNWFAAGDVSVITGNENGVAAFDQKMIRVGSGNRDLNADGKLITQNTLSQVIHQSGNKIQTISFWYNFQSDEDMSGFDEPGFMVLINDRLIYQLWANDMISSPKKGWQFISLNVADFSDQDFTLTFEAGNTSDLKKQSFVYIDNISTNPVLANSQTTFKIFATSPTSSIKVVHYRYTLHKVLVMNEGMSGLTFSLNAQPDDGKVEFWSEDLAGNSEVPQLVQVLLDNSPPAAVTDLTIYNDGEGNYTATWTAPPDNNSFDDQKVAGYDLRYSSIPMSNNQDREALSQPVSISDNVLSTALKDGQKQISQLHLDKGQAPSWFVLRSHDQAQNISPVSNVATTLQD